MKLRIVCVVVGFLSLVLSMAAQTSGSTSSTSQLQRLMKFSGTLKDVNGNPLTGIVGVTFALYSEQTGSAPLWLETQNVQADKNGHYTVMLGATKLDGVPVELFASEQAQWLGVQPQGQSEQPRVMLLSVPYALKAVDAETLGGKPASAYALATPQTGTSASSSSGAGVASSAAAASGAPPALGGSGKKDYVPLWLSSTKLGNSKLFQSTAGNVGIGNTVPLAALDVAGHNLETFIGDPGCGAHPFAGIAFGSTGFQNCQNYSMVGDSANTYIAAPTGNIYFRTASNAVTAMTIAPSGTVNVYGLSAAAGSGLGGANAVVGTGGNADTGAIGGTGVQGIGGGGEESNFQGGPGNGGSFTGGTCGDCNGGDGVFASGGLGLLVGLAGDFNGNLNVTGGISAGTKDFKIDHPLDPANKYLVHASVESSEMKDIYDGNVTTDSAGQATVQLPEWFEVLNTDFRYQLTVIGQFAQAIVGRKIEKNRFEIRTSAPNVEVSWQVTGVRQDAYAKANPLVVEQEKETRLRGFYIHPELYGAPAEKQIEWARHPQMMKRIQETRAKQQAAIRPATQPLAAQPK